MNIQFSFLRAFLFLIACGSVFGQAQAKHQMSIPLRFIAAADFPRSTH
jgi:hypothetical protein